MRALRITAMSQAAIDLLEKRRRAERLGQDDVRAEVTPDFRFVQRSSDAPPADARRDDPDSVR